MPPSLFYRSPLRNLKPIAGNSPSQKDVGTARKKIVYKKT